MQRVVGRREWRGDTGGERLALERGAREGGGRGEDLGVRLRPGIRRGGVGFGFGEGRRKGWIRGGRKRIPSRGPVWLGSRGELLECGVGEGLPGPANCGEEGYDEKEKHPLALLAIPSAAAGGGDGGLIVKVTAIRELNGTARSGPIGLCRVAQKHLPLLALSFRCYLRCDLDESLMFFGLRLQRSFLFGEGAATRLKRCLGPGAFGF
ncbi:MAG: hypothetical protein RLZZ399_1590 [Verrucomicrobiota bacterium]